MILREETSFKRQRIFRRGWETLSRCNHLVQQGLEMRLYSNYIVAEVCTRTQDQFLIPMPTVLIGPTAQRDHQLVLGRMKLMHHPGRVSQ